VSGDPGCYATSGQGQHLACPTSLKTPYGHKREFPKLSNPADAARGVGPPGIETAAPTGIEGGGSERKERNNNLRYRRPRPSSSSWLRLNDVTAALLRQRLGGTR
jgi:hypothetical protein